MASRLTLRPFFGAALLLTSAAVLGLAFARPAQAVPVRVSETYSSGNIAVALPWSEQGATAIGVRGGGPIVGVQVSVRLTHPSVRLLGLTLVSPSGHQASLVESSDLTFGEEADLGAGAADCSGTPARFAMGGASFLSASPPFVETYRPSGDFADLYGEDAYGSWRLEFSNRSSRDGVLHCWTVTVVRRAELALAGNTRAELSYLSGESDIGLPEYTKQRLRILRDGVEIFNRLLRKDCGFCEIWPEGATRGSSIRFRQLDRDDAPELLFDYWSGGASCCSLSRIYDERGGRYRETRRNWSRTGYRLIRSRGQPLLHTGDGDFICTFAACAFTPAPIQLLSFRAGKLVDVTRAHRALIKRDLARQWRFYQQMKRSKYEITGALAAWLADKHLLGEGRNGWRTLRAIVSRGEVRRYGDASGRVPYLKRLARFLRRTGYA